MLHEKLFFSFANFFSFSRFLQMFAQHIMLIYSESLTLCKLANLAELITVVSKNNERMWLSSSHTLWHASPPPFKAIMHFSGMNSVDNSLHFGGFCLSHSNVREFDRLFYCVFSNDLLDLVWIYLNRLINVQLPSDTRFIKWFGPVFDQWKRPIRGCVSGLSNKSV